MPTQLTNQDIYRLWKLASSGRNSAEARDEHFVSLLRAVELATIQDFSPLALCPLPTGLSEVDFGRRYAQIDATFSEMMRQEPKNSVLLKNYCYFLGEREFPRAIALAEEQLVPLCPDDAAAYALVAWLWRLFVIAAETNEARLVGNQKVFEALRRLVSLRGDDPGTLNYSFVELAETAYGLNRSDAARDAALHCIEAYTSRVGRSPLESVAPRVFHKAHNILGLLALDRGDAIAATEHLLASVDFPPEEQGEVDYVALTLAERLAWKGAQGAVLEFLERLNSCCCSCDRPMVAAFRDRFLGQGGIKSS